MTPPCNRSLLGFARLLLVSACFGGFGQVARAQNPAPAASPSGPMPGAAAPPGATAAAPQPGAAPASPSAPPAAVPPASSGPNAPVATPPASPAPSASPATAAQPPAEGAPALPSATSPNPATAPADPQLNSAPAPSADVPANPAPADASPAAPSTAASPDETAGIFEPPLPAPYVYSDGPKPLPPRHLAPKRSLWLGARAGWLFPLGSAWQDGELVQGACCAFTNRGMDDFATSGPALELNLGVRLGRNYNVFGLWDWALLSDGSELGEDFGGQTSARSHFLGVGLRFSSNPDSLGLLVEMALGWRQFSATWDNGTELVLTDNFLNTRIGIGADIRLTDTLSLTPLVTLGGGFFTEGDWTLADGSHEGAFSPFDREAQHVPVSLQIGLHYDALRTKD